MGWTEQEYLGQRWDFIIGIVSRLKKQTDEIKKQNLKYGR